MTTYITSLSLLHGPDALPGAETLLGLMPLAFSVAAFTLLYSAVPNARVPVRHALMGGVFTAVLFEAAKTLFGLYVSLFPGYQLIYGAFATVPIFLLWIYLSWMIVLFGAVLVCNLFFPSLAAALAAQADRSARRAEGVPPAPAAWTVATPDPLASCGLAVARG